MHKLPPAFEFKPSQCPLLVSMPHSGVALTPEVQSGMTQLAKKLPDTDWYIPQLYDFLVEMEVGYIQANYSRYVIDLNRPVNDKPLYSSKTTGLFPDILFAEKAVFEENKHPSNKHQAWCKTDIWQPYHSTIESELARLQARFGYAILFDAHSIASHVPMLFDGRLSDFNWGTNAGLSCHSLLSKSVMEVVSDKYSQVLNGRFKGGYITRSFGQPCQNIHAIQLELSQACYLDEDAQQQHIYQIDNSKLGKIKSQLHNVIATCKDITFV